MSATVLTDEQIDAILASPGDMRWVIATKKERYVLFARAIEQAVLQSAQVQELYGLLKESRQQLPLAAQFWNEDDESERRSRNVKKVMELIARVDAAMEKQK